MRSSTCAQRATSILNDGRRGVLPDYKSNTREESEVFGLRPCGSLYCLATARSRAMVRLPPAFDARRFVAHVYLVVVVLSVALVAIRLLAGS